MKDQSRIAILGAGNLGTAIASGLVQSGQFEIGNITLTRRRLKLLEEFKNQGFQVTSDNKAALNNADLILICVEPQQVDKLLDEIKGSLDPERHIVVSVLAGVPIRHFEQKIGTDTPIVRAMPNTAVAIRESMTCICSANGNGEAVDKAVSIFNTVGKTSVILEEQMTAATALCSCGIAFFLRSIRAASQGGTEIGFHAKEALQMAAQTAKGAASLMSTMENHPEFEIDRVTTPRGCTISGLNEMEHNGFSSAMIKGILLSAEKAAKLYDEG